MRLAKRILLIVFCIFLLLGGVMTYASASDDVLNLQRRVDAIAVGAGDIWRQAFENVRDGGSQAITIPDVSPGNAGAVLGYGRNDQGLLEWMFGGIVSQDSVATSYTALRNIRAEAAEGTVDIVHSHPLYQYAIYGYTVHYIGLVQNRPGFFDAIFGWLLFFGYHFTLLAPMLFGLAIGLLQLLNPFRLLSNVVDGLLYVPEPLAPAAALVGSLYTAVQNFSLFAIVPLFIVGTITSIILFRKAGPMSRIWRLVFRMFIIIAAVPLIGTSYTLALEALADTVSHGNVVANRLVMSTLVDTEAWAINQRLAPPTQDGVAMIRVRGEPGSTFEYRGDNPRDVALAINSWNFIAARGFSPGGSAWDTIDHGEGGGVPSVNQEVRSMLLRYANRTTFASGEYDAVVRSTIRVVDEEIVSMFELAPNAFTDFSPFLSGGPVTIYNNGGLHVSSSGGDTHFLNDGSALAYTRFPLRIGDQGGLSTISMYNFINSRFSDTGIAMFSPYRSPSIFTAHTIASVSPVGTSGVAVLNVLQAIVQMFALGLLGLLFGLAMFFGGFKTGLAVLASVPATLVGSIKGFARLITNTFLLITQVVATMFLYVLIGDILLALGDVVTGVISTIGGIA